MDLPNEILMMIFKKLTNEAVLYSIMGINMRLNRIMSDPSFTNQISLIKHHSSCDFTSALPGVMLDRFYFQILPQIHHKIKWLHLETLSMERILLATDYPKLRQLDIFSMNEETDIQLFSSMINFFLYSTNVLFIFRYVSFSSHLPKLHCDIMC